MFDNLVESSSHKDDLSRKGSFIIVTLLIYTVLGVAFFVAGIYWYDNHLAEQDLELTTLVAPVPVPAVVKEEVHKEEVKPVKEQPNVDVRKELIADVSRADLVPKELGRKASDIPPVRAGRTTVLGTSDSNSAAPMVGPGTGTVVVAPRVTIADEPPPPEPKATPPRAPISGGVLNGKAL